MVRALSLCEYQKGTWRERITFLWRSTAWWCSLVRNGAGAMVKKRESGKNAKKKKGGMVMVRASSSYPRELYRLIEEIATEKKVSVAWVMRDAAEKYVEDRWPLFNLEKGGS